MSKFLVSKKSFKRGKVAEIQYRQIKKSTYSKITLDSFFFTMNYATGLY